ncbi:hypothetical protein P7K49_036783 [Saguinus oedipus]|uniref:Uncharacterized protein n=1 Tax=Saguinus oedipus TaxID=9490 RepID=A0ABQ9TL69_SAGOE|nr:hypothetical protein P7K49_036783 [Saguinus oedipus]
MDCFSMGTLSFFGSKEKLSHDHSIFSPPWRGEMGLERLREQEQGARPFSDTVCEKNLIPVIREENNQRAHLPLLLFLGTKPYMRSAWLCPELTAMNAGLKQRFLLNITFISRHILGNGCHVITKMDCFSMGTLMPPTVTEPCRQALSESVHPFFFMGTADIGLLKWSFATPTAHESSPPDKGPSNKQSVGAGEDLRTQPSSSAT